MKTDLDRAQLSAYARFAKPILDRIGGLVLTVLTLPLVLVLITMSWVAFGWAPVERVARMGRNGRRFNLYRVNTRKDHQTDLRGRQLRLSRWLRSTSLDELPQVWNVTLGHLSLVGPRPLDPVTASELNGEVTRRHLVRPGLTGPWQLHARGDGRILTEHLAVDLDYLDRVSLLTDLGILLRTLPALIRHREQV